MHLSNLLKASLGDAASLESYKMSTDVEIGAPQTLITLKDALMSAEQDYEQSSFVEEEVVEFETVADSLESLVKTNQLYIRDGGMTPEMGRVYSQTFDRLIGSVGIESIGISKVGMEAFALDPLTASMEAAKETETAKASVLSKMFTKSKLFSVKLGDFLSSYLRISNNIKASVDEVKSRLTGEQVTIPVEVIGAWKSVKAVNKRMTEFTERSRMEVSTLQGTAKSGNYTRGDYKSVFDALTKGFLGESMTGGKFAIDGKGVMRFKKEALNTENTTTISTQEARKLLDEIAKAADFITSYSGLLKDVEDEISKSVVAAERQLGSKLSQSFTDYILDITSIMNSVRGPGPNYLGFLGSLCRDTLSHVKSAN